MVSGTSRPANRPSLAIQLNHRSKLWRLDTFCFSLAMYLPSPSSNDRFPVHSPLNGFRVGGAILDWRWWRLTLRLQLATRRTVQSIRSDITSDWLAIVQKFAHLPIVHRVRTDRYCNYIQSCISRHLCRHGSRIVLPHRLLTGRRCPHSCADVSRSRDTAAASRSNRTPSEPYRYPYRARQTVTKPYAKIATKMVFL